MNREKEEMLERLRVVKAAEERHLHTNGKKNVQIDDVEYCGDAIFTNPETNKQESISIYAVKEGNTTKVINI